jgi:BirA family biotin operon repressor/biotin-[acetyl-CoA-carboxylase] ligase
MSFAFRLEGDMADAVTVTAAASVAVSEALDELCGEDCKIKWVNDIYLNNKKVCGILTEAMTKAEGTVIIVGIGINCTTEAFPAEIAERAGSVGWVDREALAAAVVKKLMYFCRDLHKREWISEYRKRSLVLGEKINYTENSITKEAVAVDIDENGGLVISEDGRLKTLSTGEITVRMI